MNRLDDVEQKLARVDETHHAKLAEIHAELDKKIDTEYFDSEVLKLSNANENRTQDICQRISNVGTSVPALIEETRIVDEKIDAKVTELLDENRNILSSIAKLKQASPSPDLTKGIDQMIEKQLSSLCKPIISNAEKNRKANLDQLDNLQKKLEAAIGVVRVTLLDNNNASRMSITEKLDTMAKSNQTTQKSIGDILLQCQKLDDMPKVDESMLKELSETTNNHVKNLMTKATRIILDSNKELNNSRPLELKKEPEKQAEKSKPEVDYTKLADSINSHTVSCCDTLTKEIRARSTEANDALRRRTDAIQTSTVDMKNSLNQITKKCQDM